jgi:hypothetical protein
MVLSVFKQGDIYYSACYDMGPRFLWSHPGPYPLVTFYDKRFILSRITTGVKLWINRYSQEFLYTFVLY